MPTQPPIFRPEALGARDRRSAPGDVLRVAPGWTAWGFYALLALVAASLIAATTIHIDRYARGPTATGEGGEVVVLLPVALAPNVTEGARVELDQATAEVVAASDTVLSPTDVRQRYSVDVTTPSVSVVTSASDTAPGSVARVLVDSGPLIVQLVPGLEALLGGRGG